MSGLYENSLFLWLIYRSITYVRPDSPIVPTAVPHGHSVYYLLDNWYGFFYHLPDKGHFIHFETL